MRIASIWDERIYRRHRAARHGANYWRSVENTLSLSLSLFHCLNPTILYFLRAHIKSFRTEELRKSDIKRFNDWIKKVIKKAFYIISFILLTINGIKQKISIHFIKLYFVGDWKILYTKRMVLLKYLKI